MSSNKPSAPEGQVVYRRRVVPGDQVRARRESRLDPALLPLIIGFAVLLLLILLIGNLSVRRLEETSRNSLRLEQSYAARASLLLHFRVALTLLDTDARNRAQAESRREIRAPFDLRLDTARGKVSDLVPLLDHPPLSDLPKWNKFHNDLIAYIDITRDRNRYAQEGYTSFREVDDDLNNLIQESGDEEQQVFSQAEAMQLAATRSIRIWNTIAPITGFVIAIGTIWEVQRRFRQTKQSTEEARRGVPVVELAHVDLDQRVVVAEQEVGQRLGQLGLTDTGRAGEDERAGRALRVLQAGASTADRLGHGHYRGKEERRYRNGGAHYSLRREQFSAPFETPAIHACKRLDHGCC